LSFIGPGGNATIQSDNIAATYMAVLPTVSFGNATGANIMGSIMGTAVANGTGVMFTVNFTNLPDPMMYGPLGECPLLALDLLQHANRMALQYTISINLRSPPTETALELWRISTLQIVVSCTLAKFKLIKLARQGTCPESMETLLPPHGMLRKFRLFIVYI